MNRFFRTSISLIFMVVFVVSLPVSSVAGFPEKPVKIIVPYSPGGTSDTLTRLILRITYL